MIQTTPPEAPLSPTEKQRNGVIASRVFWIVVFLLAVGTISLSLVGSLRSTEQGQTAPVELPQTTLETLLSDTAIAAQTAVEPDIDALLDTAYAPVYQAIPEYSDFHYSVLGGYIELTEAATGQMSDALYDRLFGGFEQRFSESASFLEQRYIEQYEANLQKQVAAQVSTDGISPPLGDVTEAILQDALARSQTTLPIATVTAGVVGSGTVKVVAAAIAKKLSAKIAAKAAAKGIAKGGGVLTGAGGGALLCSWSGPGAIACGLVGGAAAWLITDAVIINLDEYFNREEFEAELRAIIDEDRANKHALLTTALASKANAMDEAVEEIFRMRDLHKYE